ILHKYLFNILHIFPQLDRNEIVISSIACDLSTTAVSGFFRSFFRSRRGLKEYSFEKTEMNKEK
ncbi:MAG: hypothetical protein WAM42_20755, partial [Candidatus Nitrosopolaris sp.]